MAELITREQIAAGTAERYRQQYGPEFGVYPFGDSAEILRQIEALGPSPTPADIEAILPGWTRNECTECNQDADQLIQVGQEPDYESATAYLCWRCAINAVALFKLP